LTAASNLGGGSVEPLVGAFMHRWAFAVGTSFFAAVTALLGSSVWAAEPSLQQLFDSASSSMRLASGFHVEETISTDDGKNSHVSADIAGDDSDITINGTTRIRTVHQASWTSMDGGRTWSTENSSENLYHFLTVPVMGVKFPDKAKLVQVHRQAFADRTVTLMELQFDPPAPPELSTRYSVVEANDKSTFEHFSGLETFSGRAVHVDADYSKINQISDIPKPQ
jgi:hypothetical protein